MLIAVGPEQFQDVLVDRPPAPKSTCGDIQ
jgi:hypothetical protein